MYYVLLIINMLIHHTQTLTYGIIFRFRGFSVAYGDIERVEHWVNSGEWLIWLVFYHNPAAIDTCGNVEQFATVHPRYGCVVDSISDIIDNQTIISTVIRGFYIHVRNLYSELLEKQCQQVYYIVKWERRMKHLQAHSGEPYSPWFFLLFTYEKFATEKI